MQLQLNTESKNGSCVVLLVCGTCGAISSDNVSRKLTEDGAMTISGTGATVRRSEEGNSEDYSTGWIIQEGCECKIKIKAT